MPSSLVTYLIRLKFITLRMRLGIVTILILTAFSISFAMWDRFDSGEPQRNVASEISAQKMMGKHLAPVSVTIDSGIRIPEYDHQEVMLTGYISLNHPFKGEVNYSWDLPEGVHLVSGDRKGSWNDLKVGQTAAVVIYVTGFSKEALKHIVLKGTVKTSKEELGHAALVSSRPEDAFEYIAPEVREHVEKVQAKDFPRGRIIK
jgi:hypothetical protein